jgi:membrane protein implicated in regulation of membrane protease activity
MILLQESIEPNGILTEVVQQGIAFAILVVIIIVLARRVIKLENKIEEMIDTRFEEVKDNAIIIKGRHVC